ncbi:MAG: alpha/beta hydrolase [Peptococcaceae bacterium]|nr:alpha/beta hydrolase [Peptococcaceae bacterium]
MPYVNANGIRIYYEVKGRGFPLVMLTGLSGNASWWEPGLIDTLAEDYQVVLLDNRGAGRSDSPDMEYSIGMFAADTLGLMDELGIAKTHLLGVSMGGMIAQEFALNYPGRLEKLVLCCTHCGGPGFIPPDPDIMELLRSPMAGLAYEEIERRMVRLLFSQRGIAAKPEKLKECMRRMTIAPISPQSFKRQLQATFKFDTWERLGNIKAPTLIMVGEDDVLIPPGNSATLAERIPGARLVTFKNAGHEFIMEVPEQFLATVREFLRGV